MLNMRFDDLPHALPTAYHIDWTLDTLSVLFTVSVERRLSPDTRNGFRSEF